MGPSVAAQVAALIGKHEEQTMLISLRWLAAAALALATGGAAAVPVDFDGNPSPALIRRAPPCPRPAP